MSNKDLKITIKIDTKTKELKIVEGDFNKLSSSIHKVGVNLKEFHSVSNSVVKGLFKYDVIKNIFLKTTEAIEQTIKTGIEFNKNMENSVAGLTALTVATSSNISVMGKHLSIMEKYRLAQIEATKTTKELIRINAQTPHTLNQTIQIYKSIYSSMKKAGATNEQMIELTKKLSIAAGAAGIEFNQLLSGVDGLATGTVLVNSDLGRFLRSMGLTNETLKNSKDVVGLLLDKFKDFKAVDTFDVALSNAKNSLQVFAGELSKPIFDSFKEGLKESSSWLDDLTKKLKEFKLENTDISQFHTIEEKNKKILSLAKQWNELNKEYLEEKRDPGLFDMSGEYLRQRRAIEGQIALLSQDLEDMNIVEKDGLKTKVDTIDIIKKQKDVLKNEIKASKSLNTTLSDQFNLWKKIKTVSTNPSYNSDYSTYYKNLFDKIGYSIKAYDKVVELYKKLMSKATTASDKNEIEKIFKLKIDNLNEWSIQSYKAHQKELKHIEKEREEYIRLHGTIKDGIEYQLKNYQSTLPTAYEQGIDMMKSITSTLDDAWTNFFDKQSDAFMDFGKLGKSIINDIEKQIVKTQIVAPLTKASSDIIGSVTGSLIDSIFSGWADGGYTYRDSSDKTPVGVVHANEYVIPANMVRNHPSLVAGLEAERRGLKRFDVGGFGGGMDGYGGDSFGGGYGMSRDDGVDGFGFGGSDYGNGTTINSINTQNFVTNITTPSTVGKTKISSGIAPADITVVNLDPNTKQEFTHFNPDGTPADDNGHHIHINIGKIGGKVVGFVIGGATTKSTAGATAGAVIGGKIGEHLSPNIDISFGSTSLAEALGAKGSLSTSMSSHISNTSDTLTSLFGDDLSGDGGDFYEKYTGQTIQQAIDDINKQIINANKADIIKTTKDIWQSMIGVIPAVKTDAKEDWTTLFKNYIKEGNKALLKVTLDGTLFNTSDFYSTWEKYAKNLNEDVQKALSDKIGDLTNNQRGFKEWLYNYNDNALGGLKYKADYLADDLAKLEKSFNVTGLSIDNFYKKQQESISKNFTPEEIDKWKQLGDALMSATDASKAYKDALKKIEKQNTKLYDDFLKNANSFLDSLYGSTSSDLGFEYYAQKYNDIKKSLTTNIILGNYNKANEDFNSFKTISGSLLQTANNTQNPTLSSSILNQIIKDTNNYLGKIPQMADGGVVTKPTLGLIGEAGYPEAVIPMKNGRDIPVKIDNSGMEQKLNDLVILTEQQANEIRKMRKEIQDMNERSAA